MAQFSLIIRDIFNHHQILRFQFAKERTAGRQKKGKKKNEQELRCHSSSALFPDERKEWEIKQKQRLQNYKVISKIP